MACLRRLAPKKFMCKYSLRSGSIAVGVFLAIISLICVIVLLIDFFFYKTAEKCSEPLLHSIYTYCICAMIYCACMFCIHLWFIFWGIATPKSSVVLSWVVITTMWWLQVSLFVIIVLSLRIMDMGLGWIAALCFAILACIIIAYCILVGYGYWLQLKNRRIIDHVVTTPTAPA